MFTGLITDIGHVETVADGTMRILCRYASESLAVGASIACDGCCLTVTSVEPAANGETQFELGGHLVTGHVDAVARIARRQPDGRSDRFTIEIPPELAPYITTKGSVALDGVSLTVNEVDEQHFGVNIIPHTLNATTWGEKRPGEHVNLEVDLLARYVARIRHILGEPKP
jgi:riboflavin synthase